MRKPLPIQLSIPSPCAESWEAMTPGAQGRFCAHCQKSVIDFTGWSDTALYDFFSRNNKPVCGRLDSSQLNRNITIPPQPHSKLYRIAIALGLTILVAQAQETRARVMPPLMEQNILTPVNDSTGSDTVVIKGQVLDEKKEPIIGAIAQLEKGGIVAGSAITDVDGFFEIKILKEDFEKLPDALQVRISYIGYIQWLAHIAKNQHELQTPFIMQRNTNANRCTGIRIVTGFVNPMIRTEQSGTNKTFNSGDLRHMGY